MDTPEPFSETDPGQRLSRRKLIIRGVAAAGVAWTAPVVEGFATPAAAQSPAAGLGCCQCVDGNQNRVRCRDQVPCASVAANTACNDFCSSIDGGWTGFCKSDGTCSGESCI